MNLDFKVKKYLQDSKLYNYTNSSSKLQINGELDTLEQIDEKFNDLCYTYEKQFDQILSSNSKSNIIESKTNLSSKSSKSVIKSKTNLERQPSAVLNRSSSLQKQLSGIVQNGSISARDEVLISQRSIQNQSDQLIKQKSILLNKQRSQQYQSTPNQINRKKTQDLSKQTSILSQNNSDSESLQHTKIPNKLIQTSRESTSNYFNLRPQTVKNQRSDTTTPSNYFSGSQTQKSSYARRQVDHVINKTEIFEPNLKSSLSRNQSKIIESPRKNSNSPSQTATYGQHQQKIQENNNKTVKFAQSQSPQIRSLKNIEEIQDNLVKMSIGSMMLEQLRISQMDLNKVDDINSFKDRYTLLSSKILKEFGINQQQVAGKKESEKKEFIKKTMDSTVNNLYKKWVKSYEERLEKTEKMEDDYENFKEKINKREKQDFEWVQVETNYKALENELKQLIVKKLNDYETQIYILENMMPERKVSSTQDQQQLAKKITSTKDFEQNRNSLIETESTPRSYITSQKNIPQNDGNSNIKIMKNNFNESPRSYLEGREGGQIKNSTNNIYNPQVKQIFTQPSNSKYTNQTSTQLNTDHSNMTDINTSTTKLSARKGISQQPENIGMSIHQKRLFNSSAVNNIQPFNAYTEDSIMSSPEKQRHLSFQKFDTYHDQNVGDLSQRSVKKITNRDGKKYVYGENLYEQEEVLDENLINKVYEQVDKSEQIKELGDKLSQQIDWKIELDNAFVEIRKQNRLKNNKISKGNNMNLVTFFPIMQDVFKNLKSDNNKEKLMQRYKEGEMLTNEQFSFLASINKLLNRFIDREYLDRGIQFFSNKGIQSHLEYLLAENIIQTYELIKQIIYEHRKNYLYHKNKKLLHEQDMFKQKQEKKVTDLQKAKNKLIMNKRMESVCRSLDQKLVIKEQQKYEQQLRILSTVHSNIANIGRSPVNIVAQKFVDNIKKSIMEKQSLRDIFINNISKPKHHIKIEEIKQKKKNIEQKQKLLDKISMQEGNDILSRLTNKAKFEDDPKNSVRQAYHPSSKLFVEENRNDNRQLTLDERKVIDHEIRRFKRKPNQTKAQDVEEQEQSNFTNYYSGGPLQPNYMSSKYYGERQIQTIIRVQAVARGYLARKILKKLKDKKKREIENRKRAEKNREKLLFKEKIKLELLSPRSDIEKILTPKSKKNGDGTSRGFTDAISKKQQKKKSRFSKPLMNRKSILTQTQFDLAMQNEMKLSYHRKVILNQDVSNRFKKLIGAAKSNNFAYIEKGKFQFFTMDVNRVDELENSSLYYAAGHVELGADINQVCENGETPFHMACQSNNKNLIMLFLQAGGNLDKCNNDGLTPLSYASFDMLQQLDAMKIISVREENTKIFKRGIPESEFQTSELEYDPSHLFAQFPSQQQQQEQQA